MKGGRKGDSSLQRSYEEMTRPNGPVCMVLDRCCCLAMRSLELREKGRRMVDDCEGSGQRALGGT